MDPLEELISRQDGVVARHQVLAEGLGDHDIARRLRRREWARLHPGVFVDHTGEPTWLQRAWGAVLVSWPAVLHGASALRVDAGPGWRGCPDSAPIGVAVEVSRTVRPATGVLVTRVTGLAERARWDRHPPRMRVEEAALDHALDQRSTLDLVEALASVCRGRATTPQRLLDTLARRERIAQRALLESALGDLRDGSCSVLEQAYLVRVERAHGLPAGARQVPEPGVYRDVVYQPWGQVVELDGRLHERTRQRDSDLERDLDVALSGRATVRLGWGQVLDRPCLTAGKIAALLAGRGWAGTVRPCGPECGLARVA